MYVTILQSLNSNVTILQYWNSMDNSGEYTSSFRFLCVTLVQGQAHWNEHACPKLNTGHCNQHVRQKLRRGHYATLKTYCLHRVQGNAHMFFLCCIFEGIKIKTR